MKTPSIDVDALDHWAPCVVALQEMSCRMRTIVGIVLGLIAIVGAVVVFTRWSNETAGWAGSAALLAAGIALVAWGVIRKPRQRELAR